VADYNGNDLGVLTPFGEQAGTFTAEEYALAGLEKDAGTFTSVIFDTLDPEEVTAGSGVPRGYGPIVRQTPRLVRSKP
jgi:hypothetical protein